MSRSSAAGPSRASRATSPRASGARATSTSRTGRTTSTSRRTGRGRRVPLRWPGLDVARGIVVLAAAVLGTGALLAPAALGPTAWWGIGLLDLLPAVFLVVAGAGAGWRHEDGVAWTTRRRWRRAGVLVAAGLAVAVARAGADPSHLAADELLRLAAATGLAALALRLPGWVLTPVAAGLLLVPAAVVTGDPAGRGMTGVDPAAGWATEVALGLPAGGVPLVSLPAAVALVLIGHALGVWARRRPPGPATAGALATVGAWSLVATIAAAQVSSPVPVLLSLPAALAGTGVAATVLAAGHLGAVTGDGAPSLEAVGRVALPLVLVGTVAVALVDADALPELPVVAALTAGGVVAAGAVGVARLLGRWRPLRA
jgi:hypothetical protein